AGKRGVLAKSLRHVRQPRLSERYKSPGRDPLQIRRSDAAKRPKMRRVHGVRRANPGRGERFADRLEVRLSVMLYKRFEEAHAEHLPFAFVDARREVLVDVVAEVVTVQERPASMRLHEVFDGRVLLGLAPKNLGDDA